MIVLDTSVLSECMKPQPNPKMLAWMASLPRSALFTTTVVEAEILYGVRILPDGVRKDGLRSAVNAIFDQDMQDRVIAFDRDCALAFADIAAARRTLGKPISQFDAMIAAATRSRGAMLATRNVQDFIDCGIELIDRGRCRATIAADRIPRGRPCRERRLPRAFRVAPCREPPALAVGFGNPLPIPRAVAVGMGSSMTA